MRRNDREIAGTPDILAVLNECGVIRIGLSADGAAYIVPMNFAFETVGKNVHIYVHCAPEGRKLDMIAKNNIVCFEADRSYGVVKAETACRWSYGYESVMGNGTITKVTGKDEKLRAMDLLMKRYGLSGRPGYDENMLTDVTVLRITVTSMTGKSNTAGRS
ncbi:MAG: pyridoxamine 5'-phosphate oxidase family protein [Methanomassiliicoccaceae archaeon]|nr:pyridoxamine 5'-phosphate oxidase family protein [Methanomassiliicoccaceae archaeon]